MSISKIRFTNTNKPLNGAVVMRGDSIDLVVTHVEPRQAGATLRFSAMMQIDYPNGVSIIRKEPDDFDVVLTVDDRVLRASFSILPDETSYLLEQTVFRYDLQRSIPSEGSGPDKITTLEKGSFTVEPDITPN